MQYIKKGKIQRDYNYVYITSLVKSIVENRQSIDAFKHIIAIDEDARVHGIFTNFCV